MIAPADSSSRLASLAWNFAFDQPQSSLNPHATVAAREPPAGGAVADAAEAAMIAPAASATATVIVPRAPYPTIQARLWRTGAVAAPLDSGKTACRPGQGPAGTSRAAATLDRPPARTRAGRRRAERSYRNPNLGRAPWGNGPRGAAFVCAVRARGGRKPGVGAERRPAPERDRRAQHRQRPPERADGADRAAERGDRRPDRPGGRPARPGGRRRGAARRKAGRARRRDRRAARSPGSSPGRQGEARARQGGAAQPARPDVQVQPPRRRHRPPRGRD